MVFMAVSPAETPFLFPVAGRVEGEVKLSMSYRNSTLYIMVMHIKGLVSPASNTRVCPYRCFT